MENSEVLAFLESYPLEIRDIALELTRQVREVVPTASEKVYSGWKLIGYRAPQGKKDFYFCYVAPYQSHVDLGFEYGTMMNDPLGVLAGKGKQVKYIRCSSLQDTQKEFISSYIKEGLEVARHIRFGKED